jgi:hypothetical protein
MVRAAFWTVTSRFLYSLDITTYTYGSTEDYYTYTSTRTISPSITPTSAAVSTTTYHQTYNDLDVVSVFYPPGAVANSDLEPTDYPNYSTPTRGTIFMMSVTYTAPASCTSSFTWATEEVVAVPTEVIDQVTPSTIVTEAPFTYSTYTAMGYETWYLTPEAVPFTTSEEYYYSVYIAHCETPYSSTYDDDDNDNYRVCSLYSGCTTLRVWVIIIATLLPSLFVLGFLESWFWFRRLMTGRGALRGGTVCWICISLWVACFTRSQSARSADDQKLLREQWNKMSSGTAFKLWWKWGFKHRYPEELLGKYSRNTVGIVPPNGPAPNGQYGYGPGGAPMMGQVVMPPPAYINQQGGSMAPQGPYEPGKEVAMSNVSESYPPTQTQSPPPGAPPSTISPVSQQYQTPPPQGQYASPPIPAPYAAQSPPPQQGPYATPAPYQLPTSPPPQSASPSQVGPPIQSPQPYPAPQSPPPGQAPFPNQGPPPGQAPFPNQGPPPQGP